jgi:hypothetical protein
MTSPAILPHQDLSLFLARLMAEFAEAHDLGRVLTAPFQMRLPNVRRGREPDLLFVATANLDRLRTNFLDGPTDLVVEIISPESLLRTAAKSSRSTRSRASASTGCSIRKRSGPTSSCAARMGATPACFPTRKASIRVRLCPASG